MIHTALTCLLLAAPQDVPGAPPGAAKPKIDPERIITQAGMLPPDAIAVVSMARLARHQNALQTSGAARLFESVSTTLQRGDLMANLNRLGLPEADLWGLVAGGCSLALCQGNGKGQAHWLFVANLTGRSDLLAAALEKSHETLTRRGTTVRAEVVLDTKVWQLRGIDGSRSSYAIYRDTLIAADEPAQVEAAMRRRTQKRPSLMQSRSFLRYATRCSYEGAPFLTVLVQPQEAVKGPCCPPARWHRKRRTRRANPDRPAHAALRKGAAVCSQPRPGDRYPS